MPSGSSGGNQKSQREQAPTNEGVPLNLCLPAPSRKPPGLPTAILSLYFPLFFLLIFPFNRPSNFRTLQVFEDIEKSLALNPPPTFSMKPPVPFPYSSKALLNYNSTKSATKQKQETRMTPNERPFSHSSQKKRQEPQGGFFTKTKKGGNMSPKESPLLRGRSNSASAQDIK